MEWFEDIQTNDYMIEVSSLSCPYRDRERIGKILLISRDYVIIQTDNGDKIKWVDGKLLKIPSLVMF